MPGLAFAGRALGPKIALLGAGDPQSTVLRPDPKPSVIWGGCLGSAHGSFGPLVLRPTMARHAWWLLLLETL